MDSASVSSAPSCSQDSPLISLLGALYATIFLLISERPLNVQSLQDDMQWFLDRGYIQQTVDMATLVDHQFVDWALGFLGQVPQ